jgi:hypothetical protein
MPRYKAGASRGQALVALNPILFPLTLYLKPRSRGRYCGVPARPILVVQESDP